MPDLRKVESKKSVVRTVMISSGSEDSEGSVWSRVAHPRRSVLSEEEEKVESKRAWGATSAGGQKAVKLLKDWVLKFSGDEREDPEEFLERLEDCRNGAEVGERSRRTRGCLAQYPVS